MRPMHVARNGEPRDLCTYCDLFFVRRNFRGVTSSARLEVPEGIAHEALYTGNRLFQC